MTEFPSIEDLVLPHLERCRKAIEAKRGDVVGEVEISFRSQPLYGLVAVACRLGQHDTLHIRSGRTVDIALKGLLEDIRPLPDGYAVLGLTSDGKFKA